MKTAYPLMLLVATAAFLSSAGCASKYKTQPSEPAPVKSVTTVVAAPAAAPVGGDDQQLYGGASVLPQQQRAGEIINDFRPVYEKLGKPRLVFYINRDLKGGTQPASTTTTRTRNGEHTVVVKTDKETFNLADKQTARDIERIAGTPFRQAGATLADRETLETGAKDAAPAADVAIETFVTSRQVTLPSISGAPSAVTIPDIQMTAIRLSDSAILGQATANDIVNQLPPAAIGSLNVHDALEATALNLMSDITARAR